MPIKLKIYMSNKTRKCMQEQALKTAIQTIISDFSEPVNAFGKDF